MHIKPLTSLRFIFALMVFGSHVEFAFKDNPTFESFFSHVLSEGFIGVGFFFTLSGFVLALNYEKAFQKGTISSKEFWIARFARIYPLHLATLLLSIPFTLTTFQTQAWVFKLLSNIFLVQGFIPVSDYFFSFNAPSWSLSVEMFFYLMFPFILVIKKRYPVFSVIFFLIMIITTLSAYQFIAADDLHAWLYIHPLFRLTDFILGIFLFGLFNRGKFEILFRNFYLSTFTELFAIGVFIGFFVFHEEVSLHFRYDIYYWIPVAMVIFTFAHSKGIFSRLLSYRIPVLLGKISFGFYLFHWLILRGLSGLHVPAFENSPLALILFALTLTIVISYFSRIFFEEPIKRGIKYSFLKVKNTKEIPPGE